MDSQPALEKCPFCGGEAEIEYVDLPLEGGYYVVCNKCDAQMGDSDDTFRDPAYVSALWNRRVPAPQPPQAMPYSHRNGETDAPTVEGWYWCYWKSQDGTIDTAPGGGIPMEWYNGCWRDNQVGAPFKGIPPAICYGPITPPRSTPAP